MFMVTNYLTPACLVYFTTVWIIKCSLVKHYYGKRHLWSERPILWHKKYMNEEPIMIDLVVSWHIKTTWKQYFPEVLSQYKIL